MSVIKTGRLILRPFTETDYDDLYEFLSQLRDDEFEGYPGITYENGRSIFCTASPRRSFTPSGSKIPGR